MFIRLSLRTSIQIQEETERTNEATFTFNCWSCSSFASVTQSFFLSGSLYLSVSLFLCHRVATRRRSAAPINLSRLAPVCFLYLILKHVNVNTTVKRQQNRVNHLMSLFVWIPLTLSNVLSPAISLSISMSIYLSICIHMCTYMHIYIYTYIYIHRYMCNILTILEQVPLCIANLRPLGCGRHALRRCVCLHVHRDPRDWRLLAAHIVNCTVLPD